MACRRRRECDPDRGSALPTSAQDERRDREVGRRKRKFSAHPPCSSVHGTQQRGKSEIAHNFLFRTRKKGTASRAVFRVNAAASPSSGKAGASPPRTMPETGDATGTDAGMSTTDPQEADKAAGNGRRAGRETTVAAVRGAHPAMFRRIHPAILLKQTRLVPRFRSPEQELPRAHKKGVPQNRSSAERPTVTTQGLPGASIAPSPTG